MHAQIILIYYFLFDVDTEHVRNNVEEFNNCFLLQKPIFRI